MNRIFNYTLLGLSCLGIAGAVAFLILWATDKDDMVSIPTVIAGVLSSLFMGAASWVLLKVSRYLSIRFAEWGLNPDGESDEDDDD